MAQPAPGSDLPDCFAGSQPDPVPDGGILTVAFEDRARAGQAVEVELRDADDPTETRRLSIKLRGNGRGSAQFIVPVGWAGVVLRCDGARERRVAVALPP